jgi:hypothetical protein
MKISKWLRTIIFVVCCVSVASFAWSVEPFLKIDGSEKTKIVLGVITKIEGNKITLRDEAGKLITIGVRGESTDDKHRLRRFQVGDKVKIEGGKLIKLPANEYGKIGEK